MAGRLENRVNDLQLKEANIKLYTATHAEVPESKH